VQSLTADQIKAAAGTVESFAITYRREHLRARSRSDRAQVWRNHIKVYVAAHPNLDTSVLALLANAASLATPEQFTTPTDEGRQQIRAIADQLTVLVGREDTLDVLYRLGPKDVGFVSALPVMQQLANFVRGQFIVQANAEDCDCNTSFGCDGGGGAYCKGGVGCNRDESWPMCGWWWNEVCDGLCAAGIEG
jgi:hypothetical protein